MLLDWVGYSLSYPLPAAMGRKQGLILLLLHPGNEWGGTSLPKESSSCLKSRFKETRSDSFQLPLLDEIAKAPKKGYSITIEKEKEEAFPHP